MKLNFKKISAVFGSVIMAGASLGFAAAAAYPAPFVQNGVANVAIVTGGGAGVSALDATNAGSIEANLGTYVTGGTTTVNGEHVELDRPSTLMHIGNTTTQVFGRQVTKTDLPTLLADGTYRDNGSTDHDYTQTLNLSNLKLNYFDESSYGGDSNTPAIGVNLSSEDEVLNYTLTFQDQPNVTSKMRFTNIDIMGKTYYVLSATTSEIDLLDSSASASLSQGGSTTLTAGNATYTVSAPYIDSNGNVKLTVNGETTDTLQKGDTYKLSDGSYVGIKDVLAQAYSGGASQVDFAIGAGKIVLKKDLATVQVNGNSVDGLKSNFTTSSGKISKIIIQWTIGGDNTAVTKDNSVTIQRLLELHCLLAE
jgi:hypothetical protein